MHTPALVLAAHGSRSRRARAAFARFVNAVRHATNAEVHDAFLDVEEPSVAEVVGSINGPRIVVPMTLFEDASIAAMLGSVGVDPLVTIEPALGPDWVLAEVMAQRLFEAGARPEDSILLAAGEVTDPRGVADVGQAARLLSGVWGGRVHIGTLGGPDTGLSDAVDIARAYGGRVVVASYVLTGGDVHDVFGRAGADHVTVPLLDTSGPPDPRLVGLTVKRRQPSL